MRCLFSHDSLYNLFFLVMCHGVASLGHERQYSPFQTASRQVNRASVLDLLVLENVEIRQKSFS